MPSFKTVLKSHILQQRGGAHARPLVMKQVEEMDEASAQEWWRLVQAIEDEVRMQMKSKARRMGIPNL